jgi:pimeloyl-ACP methyl ester carboxylesterase
MNSNKWVVHDRGFEKNLVYFPGWATDISFLQQDKMPFNLIYPESLITPNHLNSLAELLSEPALILGWSLGGFLALQFARQCPGKISSMIIASIRQHYPKELIAPMRSINLPDMRKTQQNFYKQVFFPTMLTAYRTFKQGENDLANSMDYDDLLTGLDYLENNAIGDAPSIPITYLHGEKDVIAPVCEGIAWAIKNGVECIVVQDAPHVLPFCDQFYEIINDKFN